MQKAGSLPSSPPAFYYIIQHLIALFQRSSDCFSNNTNNGVLCFDGRRVAY